MFDVGLGAYTLIYSSDIKLADNGWTSLCGKKTTTVETLCCGNNNYLLIAI